MCCGGVVVARADVQVVLDVLALAPDDQRDLGVGLQAEQSIDHVHVGLFESSCPTDVGLFIASSFQLDERHDLLASFSGANQGPHHRARRPGIAVGRGRGIARRPVQRLLDGEDVGVARGVVDEGLDRRGE